MKKTALKQRTTNLFAQETHLLTWIEAFLFDRRAQGLTPGTVEFYRRKLLNFTKFCESQAITQIDQIDPNSIRFFLIHLEDTDHNPGGVHAHYRTLKTFLYWWEDEVEPEDWRNPIRKVKAPRVNLDPIDPVPIETIRAMLSICERQTFEGDRDRAIFLTLADTGVRAGELLRMDLDDIDLNGAILIRRGKGRKPRTVFLGKKSRRRVRAYLRKREDHSHAVWVTVKGTRLTYWGLRQIMVRRSEQAGVDTPSVHGFRRFFALTCLREGMDIFTLQHLMGHADIQVLRRYLAQTNNDLLRAHRRSGPVDHVGL
ncbi:MAG: tyrosine-type recombinase/integrase [Anaerolineales bacterium]|jgi:site-specific recombinase XerD